MVARGRRLAVNVGLRKAPPLATRARRWLWGAVLPGLSAGKRTLLLGKRLLTGGRDVAR
jgi:hypothetical protein